MKISKEVIQNLKNAWQLQYGDSYNEGFGFLVESLNEQNKEIDQVIKEIISGKPIQQIIGEWSFYSGAYYINEHVLIPRPETEQMVDCIKSIVKSPSHIIDLGTGSGCIAIELAKIYHNAIVQGVDKSLEALKVANINNQQIDSKVNFYFSDWFSNVDGIYDLIVSNPPYVSENIKLNGSLDFEPKTSIFSAENGLKDIKHIISNAERYLMPEGYLFLEHGEDQKDSVQELLNNYGFNNINTGKDLSGSDRYTYAQK